MSSRSVIDAHTHVFPLINGRIGSGRTTGSALGTVIVGTERIQSFPPIVDVPVHTPDMLIRAMDLARVEKAVLLQGPYYGECNAFVLQAVEKYPTRLAAAAYVDPWDDEFDKNRLRALLGAGEYRAVKLECSVETGLFGLHDHATFKNPELNWFWDYLESEELVLVLDLGSIGSRSYDTEAVEAIARGHPHLQVVICHLAHPSPAVFVDQLRSQRWSEQVRLAQMENVWLDAASLPALFDSERFPYESAREVFQDAVETVGAGKIMWGTDTPGLLVKCTYRQLIDLGEIFTSDLDEIDREKVLCANADRVFFDRGTRRAQIENKQDKREDSR